MGKMRGAGFDWVLDGHIAPQTWALGGFAALQDRARLPTPQPG
jgi:hypothetical protein